MLEIHDISTFYGNIKALKGVSLEVGAGEIVSLIGANGAGKTTLLNSISGVVPPKLGAILIDNENITCQSPEEIVGCGISQVPERRQVFGNMSVRDNLTLGAYRRLQSRKERRVVQKDMDYVFSLFPRLKDREKQYAGTLSGGEQQMLAIGRGLMARPKVLLLDEPSLGLAPILVQEILMIVQQLRENNKTTILLVEQNARAALRISDRGYVLETGKVVLSGTAEELMTNVDVQRAYLGQDSDCN